MATNSHLFRQLYFKTTGYSYPNLGRLFLRLFVGLMLAQFGVRQLMSVSPSPDSWINLPYISSDLHLWLVITVELVCSFFIMIGLFMRLMIIPPFILMISSCHHIATSGIMEENLMVQLLCVPFLFMGIFLFLTIVGPGKISVDYFFSLYLINRHQDKDKEEDLEEV